MNEPEWVFVRANSHRAYQKLRTFVYPAVCYYNPEKLFSDASKGYYKIPLSLLEDALKIKGVTKPNKQDGYMESWS